MRLSILRNRKRGQIRTVDFVVSLFLFLLMLSQLIIIILNVQYGIKSGTIGIIAYEELDILGRQILQEEGEANWGYIQDLPNSFGLADSNSQTFLTLDASKITRIITGSPATISLMSGFELYDYTTLKKAIGLNREYEFQLGFYTSLKVEVDVSTDDFVYVNVTNPYDTPVAKALVSFFTIDLTNGDIISEGSLTTDSTGKTSRQLSNPSLNDPEGEHIVFIIAEKGPLWGMSWGFRHPISDEVNIGSSSNIAIWGSGIDSSTLLISDILSNTPDSHYISVIYQNTTSGYSNKTINLGTSPDGNETVTVPTDGLNVFLSIARTDNNYDVGIGTYPAILNRDLTSGMFYQVFGESIPSEGVESMLSKTYPIIVRGKSMRCQLTLWSN